MSEQAKKPTTQSAVVKKTKKTLKHWVAIVLFAAIILVFALWGVGPSSKLGEAGGGVVATVNETAISLAEYRSRVESIEQNAKVRFDQFPEAQRKALSQELRRRALEELIQAEVIYQEANSRGIVAPDAEVRDYILQIPVLQENGRFEKQRYRTLLQNMNLSIDDFERQVRKQIVQQKLQDLFIGSANASREELNRNRQLAAHRLNIRYVEITKDDLMKPAFLAETELAEYSKTHATEIEKFYKDNSVEFTTPEKLRARHILIKVDDQRTDAQAAQIVKDLKVKATAKNFAELAQKSSDDPGSKVKGGDLGEFERGRMVPEFEKAAFALAPGEISEPVKTNFGYHLIFAEGKTPGGLQPLEKVRGDIARRLFLRTEEAQLLAKAKAVVESPKEVQSLVQRAQLKWVETGEFDLASSSLPKMGEGQEVLRAIIKHGNSPGVIPQLIESSNKYYIVDLLAWKVSPNATTEDSSAVRMVASRKSSDLIEAWAKEVEGKATIHRNTRYLQ